MIHKVSSHDPDPSEDSNDARQSTLMPEATSNDGQRPTFAHHEVPEASLIPHLSTSRVEDCRAAWQELSSLTIEIGKFVIRTKINQARRNRQQARAFFLSSPEHGASDRRKRSGNRSDVDPQDDQKPPKRRHTNQERDAAAGPDNYPPVQTPTGFTSVACNQSNDVNESVMAHCHNDKYANDINKIRCLAALLANIQGLQTVFLRKVVLQATTADEESVDGKKIPSNRSHCDNRQVEPKNPPVAE